MESTTSGTAEEPRKGLSAAEQRRQRILARGEEDEAGDRGGFSFACCSSRCLRSSSTRGSGLGRQSGPRLRARPKLGNWIPAWLKGSKLPRSSSRIPQEEMRRSHHQPQQHSRGLPPGNPLQPSGSTRVLLLRKHSSSPADHSPGSHLWTLTGFDQPERG